MELWHGLQRWNQRISWKFSSHILTFQGKNSILRLNFSIAADRVISFFVLYRIVFICL